MQRFPWSSDVRPLGQERLAGHSRPETAAGEYTVRLWREVVSITAATFVLASMLSVALVWWMHA